MDESVKSSAGMEVSVSFGRFENDVLSWEKWSSFSPNKYLEEVGNLSTPGSVAQKKAYFEAHYKKIAARKAEELEQEKSMVLATTSSLDESSNDDCMETSSRVDAEFGLSIGERSVENAAQGECAAPLTDLTCGNEAKDDNSDSDRGTKQESSENLFVEGIGGNDLAAIRVECASCLVEEAKDELIGNVVDFESKAKDELIGNVVTLESKAKDELIGNVVDLESNTGVEAAPVEVETRRENSRQTKEIPPARKHGATPKLNARGVAQKVNIGTCLPFYYKSD